MRSVRIIRAALGAYLCFLCPYHLSAKDKIQIELIVNWEGRNLEQPNIEAIMKLRAAEPDLPFTHLYSPRYFDIPGNHENSLRKLALVLEDKDEVGLYLSAQRELLNAAKVVLRSAPSFWSPRADAIECEDDCGLDVPLAIMSREDLIKIFTYADSSLRKAGFTRLRTFAVRGGLKVPLLDEIAGAFGYRFDLSRIDSQLMVMKLDPFPLSLWLENQVGLTEAMYEGSQTQKAEDSGRLLVQGGFLELHSHDEILKRFSNHIDKSPDFRRKAFSIHFSQESAVWAVPRLKKLMQELRIVANERQLEIEYRTHSGEKNGRPIDGEQRISENL